MVFVDIDGTILSVSSEKLFVQHLVKKGMLSAPGFLRFLTAYLLHPAVTLKRGKGWNRSYLKGMQAELVEKEAREFGRHLFAKYSRPQVTDIVRRIREGGSTIALISATLSFLAEGIAMVLPADMVQASMPEISNGFLTGELASVRPWGRDKVPVVESVCRELGVTPEMCMAAGDSWADRHMMSRCGGSVAVCPDRRLRKLAGARGWQLVEGRHTKWA